VKRLDRSAVPAPACLGNYTHGEHNWSDVASADRVQIRAHLEQMQGRHCAYCEGPLDVLGHHIEHFRRKHLFQQLTFSWSNLYWSCDQTDSCGHYKDHGAGVYNVDELIDPCIDDPDRFFRFRSDGTITVRSNLQVMDQHRANETLRVFNLHPRWGRLRNMRKAAIAGYVSLADPQLGFSASELREFFSDELALAATQPFYTAVRHVLTEP